MSTGGLAVRGVQLAALFEVAKRPGLWLTAARQARALAPARWWARWPPLPLPPPGYIAFRLECMYGTGKASISGPDLVAYLEWCRRMRDFAR
ncbi:MAG TPA: hypothetical protein VK425_04760 [Acidimicrobiales bacterium]|nr:hypothetical protein [Acidimicrobiales bacterium]